MKIPRKWGAFLLLIHVWCALAFGQVAQANTYTQWRVMHKDTHPATTESLVEQCERDAKHQSDDPLELKHCKVLETMVHQGKCQDTFVRNGVSFAFLNGVRNGRPYVAENQIKMLGGDPERKDKALRCEIDKDRGIIAIWFTGETQVGKESCNNLNFLAWPPKPVAVEPPTPQPPVEIPAIELQDPEEPEEECRERETVTVGQAYGHGGEEALFLPGTPAWCPTGSNTPTLYVRPSEKGIKGGKITSADCY